jgi:hypothetical protein
MSVNLGGYGNTVLGGITLTVFVAVGWCVKNRMKHSRCDLDSKCLKFSTREDGRKSTIRKEVLDELRRDGILPPLAPPRLTRSPSRGFGKPVIVTPPSTPGNKV